MKRLYIYFAFSLLFCAPLLGKDLPGKVIFKDRTIDVVIDVPFRLIPSKPDFEIMQHRINYTDAQGKKIKLRPQDALEVQFKYDDELIRMISVNRVFTGALHIGADEDYKFLKLEMDGKLKLYTLYRTDYSNSKLKTVPHSKRIENAVFQKGSDPIIIVEWGTFKKDMRKFFSDCPALIQKIDSKEFDRKDTDKITEFYNSKCGK